MAEDPQEVAVTSDVMSPSEPSPVRKVTYTFDASINGRKEFALIHNLGTREVLVSCRTRNGNVKALKTYAQDDNVLMVTTNRDENHYLSFDAGDTLIAIG